ncbi:arsenosugar biosynthesis radical SAM (seleno)protein ArsS [Thermodesulfobacteriota bacterium]
MLEPKDTISEVKIDPFHLMLSSHGLEIKRDQTRTLQINVGFKCNQKCQHCHLDAGPERTENMTRETMLAVVDYARRNHFDMIDITGGAPELNSHVEELIEQMAALVPRVMFRSNLSALNSGKRQGLMQVLKANQVVVVASLPSLNASQTESQRGKGIFDISIEALLKLNRLSYGLEGSGLELNLVSNPSGAFLPAAQDQTEKRFRRILEKNWGIHFNNLFSFANVPLGRYREWLIRSGNFALYMEKLASSFNPCAVSDVMCRTMVSISWDGYLYDCDFNIARGIYMGGRKIHVSEMKDHPEPGSVIATADHCYACTAGSGFT